MNPIRLDEQPPWVRSSVEGAERGLVVSLALHPLEVVKVNRQKDKIPYARVISQLWKEGGVPRFYQGFSPQVMKCVIQQLWRWPLMTEIPYALSEWDVPEGIFRQSLTGAMVGPVDTIGSFGLEKIKILAATGDRQGVLRKVWQEGTKGMGIHMTKNTCGWVTFLTSQDYLRRQARTSSDKPLSFSQNMAIGAQVAGIVWAVSAPLDYATTRKFTTGQSTSFTKGISQLYRGSIPYFLGLLTHNIASVFLLERLEQKRRLA